MSIWKKLFGGSKPQSPKISAKENSQHVIQPTAVSPSSPPAGKGPPSRMDAFVEAISSDLPRFSNRNRDWWSKVWNAVGDGDRDPAQMSEAQRDFTLVTLDIPSRPEADRFLLSLSFAKQTDRGIQLDGLIAPIRSLKIESSDGCPVLLTGYFTSDELIEILKRAREKGYKVKPHPFGDEAKRVISVARQKEAEQTNAPHPDALESTASPAQRPFTSEDPCPECGFPSTKEANKRGIEIDLLRGVLAWFKCPGCGQRISVEPPQIDKSEGVQVLCDSCHAIVFVPPSVWCKTCGGNSLSTGWQSTVAKIRQAMTSREPSQTPQAPRGITSPEQSGDKAEPPAVPGGEDQGEGTFVAAGLTWQRVPAASEMSWEDAKSYAARLALAGGGWRLPEVNELNALYQAKMSSPAIAAFPGMDNGAYWSASPVEIRGRISEHYAYVVHFHDGAEAGLRLDQHAAVRCVK